MDVNQYLEIFLDETKEHLESLNAQILKLEQEPEDVETINEIFRAAHSLKGMAGTMGYKRMQNLTHDMENVFSEIRNGSMKVSATLIDTLFQCLDALEEYTANIQETADEGTNENIPLIEQLNEYLKSGGKAEPEVAATEKKEEKKTESAEEKWLEIKLGDSEKTVLGTAKAQGKKIYGLTIYVQESCLLKAARAFLVYKAVEEKAEIMVCNPPAQDIEDEKFDLDFSLIVIADCPLEEILQAARNVSEIEKVLGAEYEIEAVEVTETSEIAETEVTAATTVQQQTTAPAKGADKKSSGKPVVNRTVRVDIEKLDVLMNLVSELIIAKNSLVSAATTEGVSGAGVNEQIEYLELSLIHI